MNDVRSDVYTIGCQKLVDHKNRNTFNYTNISHSWTKSISQFSYAVLWLKEIENYCNSTQRS